MIKLYNSLTGKKENFKPIKSGNVGIYSCGPTVYSEQHIGNMRTTLLADFLIRILKHHGFKIKHIMNYTDVGHLTSGKDTGEDKVEKAAKKVGLTAKEITKKYIDLFELDLEKLNIQLGKRERATDNIKEQIALIKKLEKKKYTYETSDGIYFDSKKFKSYGKLAGFGKIERQEGKRIALGEKKNSTDFALWKFSGNESRLQEWDSPWGVGFPGWHLECSAMSMKNLGEHFDIHTGGQDLSQVHHNNEIAQSEAATGKKFVNYWLHGGFILFKEEKLSKSKGNTITLSELEEDFSPMHFRYLCLLTHYKKPLNFTFDKLDSAKVSYERIKRKILELKKQSHKGSDSTKQYESQFHKAIYDDLNLPKAIQVFIKTLDDFDFDSKKRLKLLEHFDSVLGIGIKEMKPVDFTIPKEVTKLLQARERFRKNKMWAEADVVRNRIKDKGYIVLDKEKGPKLEKL